MLSVNEIYLCGKFCALRHILCRIYRSRSRHCPLHTTGPALPVIFRSLSATRHRIIGTSWRHLSYPCPPSMSPPPPTLTSSSRISRINPVPAPCIPFPLARTFRQAGGAFPQSVSYAEGSLVHYSVSGMKKHLLGRLHRGDPLVVGFHQMKRDR